jgi:type IV pilus assembly protein PilW
MTLIELLVAMGIGVGVVLAVSTLLAAGENHKRTTTSTNDADQTGTYAFYALDKAVRSAGSAIAETAYPSDRGVLGCRLNAGTAGNAGVFLPRAGAFPAPFSTNFLNSATNTLRVAPVLIAYHGSDNNTSDVLVVMSGAGTAGGVSRAIYGAGSATSLVLENAVAFSQYDLVLVSQPVSSPALPECLLEEVAAVNPTSLTLTNSSTYPYYTTGSTTTISTLAGSTASYVTPLGNASANNVQFTLYGVSTNNVLYSYDLLQNLNLVQGTGGDVAQAITDGVMRMNAIYGVATTANPGVFNGWASPSDTADGYDIATVMKTPATIRNIICVRIALMVRGEYYDKNTVSPSTITLFNGLKDINGNSLAIPVTSLDQHYRYREFEFTVPLRNMLILAGATGS